MPITEKTSKIIWGQCAALCCICRDELVYSTDGAATSLVGEVAHIVGEKETAARGESDLDLAERNDPDNLLLLCRKHHKIVDDDQNNYSVDRLHQIKEEHIAWVAASLVKPRPWRTSIAQFSYINVPRLCEQAKAKGFAVDLSQYRENQTLHSLGWELNHVMHAFHVVLPQLTFSAVSILEMKLHEGFVGASIKFERQRFRTKNIPMTMTDKVAQKINFTGDLAKDSHIYVSLSEFRLVLYIDPKWITTSTAFTLFRPSGGQSVFSGVGIVTSVDYEARVITATPWALGVPESIFDNVVDENAESATNLQVSSCSDLDALVDMEGARKNEVYFTPPPTNCDLCRKSFESEKYMIDGAVKGIGGWACMCEACFLGQGKSIGEGFGQLYIRDGQEWLGVAGFSFGKE